MAHNAQLAYYHPTVLLVNLPTLPNVLPASSATLSIPTTAYALLSAHPCVSLVLLLLPALLASVGTVSVLREYVCLVSITVGYVRVLIRECVCSVGLGSICQSTLINAYNVQPIAWNVIAKDALLACLATICLLN